MTELMIELPAEIYQKLKQEAENSGKSPEKLAQEWLTGRVENPPSQSQRLADREKLRNILAAAGLLSELGPDLKKMADPTISLEEVQRILGNAGGKPLSEIVIEQREQDI